MRLKHFDADIRDIAMGLEVLFNRPGHVPHFARIPFTAMKAVMRQNQTSIQN